MYEILSAIAIIVLMSVIVSTKEIIYASAKDILPATQERETVVCAAEDIVIGPHESIVVDLKMSIMIPPGYLGMIADIDDNKPHTVIPRILRGGKAISPSVLICNWKSDSPIRISEGQELANIIIMRCYAFPFLKLDEDHFRSETAAH